MKKQHGITYIQTLKDKYIQHAISYIHTLKGKYIRTTGSMCDV